MAKQPSKKEAREKANIDRDSHIWAHRNLINSKPEAITYMRMPVMELKEEALA